MHLPDFKDRYGKWVRQASIGGVSRKTLAGSIWFSMLARCGDKFKDLHPTYSECTTTFTDFQRFTDWCHSQVGYGQPGFQLDKDILVKGNKVYSEETCAFVPREVNYLFTSRKTMRGPYPIGVCWMKRVNKFTAHVKNNGKVVHLGYFDNKWDAFMAYKLKKEEIIKACAETYKNVISEKVYNAMVQYSVDADD